MGPITCGYLVKQIGSLWGALAMGPNYMCLPGRTDWIFMGSPSYGVPITCEYLVYKIGSLWGALAMGPYYM